MTEEEPTEYESVVTAISALDQWVNELQEAVLEYTYDPDKDVEEVAELYFMLSEVSKGVRTNMGFLEQALGKLMSVYDTVALGESGVSITKNQGQQRTKWDHRTVRSVVSEKIMEEFVTDDGTIDAPISRVIDRAFDYTGLKWKLTPLREAGLDPDDYSEKSDGRISYSIDVDKPSDDKENNDDVDPF